MVETYRNFNFVSTSFQISMGETKKMIVLFLIFFSHLGFTQNLTGDWLNVKRHNVLSDPNIHIIQATENSLIHRDFDKKLFAERYHVKGNEVFCNDTLRYRIDEFDPQLMTLGYVNEATGETVFKTKYVKLQTSIKEGPLEMIKQNTYILKLNNEVIKIRLGRLLEDHEVFHIGNHFGNFLDIEEVQGIYYLTIYLNGFLIKVCPFKSLSVGKLVFYGFDEENPNTEVTASLHI